MTGQDNLLPQDMESSIRADFHVFRDFIVKNFGEAYLSSIVRHGKAEFAKIGVLGWAPTDANIVIDVCPMPHPWVGEWGYRIRFAAILGDGSAHINQFYIPQSIIPAFRKGDLSAIS